MIDVPTAVAFALVCLGVSTVAITVTVMVSIFKGWF